MVVHPSPRLGTSPSSFTKHSCQAWLAAGAGRRHQTGGNRGERGLPAEGAVPRWRAGLAAAPMVPSTRATTAQARALLDGGIRRRGQPEARLPGQTAADEQRDHSFASGAGRGVHRRSV